MKVPPPKAPFLLPAAGVPLDCQVLGLLSPLSGRENVQGPNSPPKPQPPWESSFVFCRVGLGEQREQGWWRPCLAQAARGWVWVVSPS